RLNGVEINLQIPVNIAPAFRSFGKLNFSIAETLNLTQQNSIVFLEGKNVLNETTKTIWMNELISNNKASLTQLLIANQLTGKISDEELMKAFLSRFDAKSEVKYGFSQNDGFLNSYEQNFEYTNINKFTGSLKIRIRKDK